MPGLLKNPRKQGQDIPGNPEQPAGMSDAPVPAQGAGMQGEGETPGASPADENDPNFQRAMTFAMQTLYQEGAADNISESLKAAPEKVDALANTAYEITAIVDERTEGSVPDELLMLLGSNMLEEVADIAMASGVDLAPADIAEAFKLMVLRYLGENGYDTRELQTAMDGINPDDINRLVSEDQPARNEGRAPASDQTQSREAMS